MVRMIENIGGIRERGIRRTKNILIFTCLVAVFVLSGWSATASFPAEQLGVLLQRAQEHFDSGKVTEAIDDYQQITQKYPDSGLAWFQLAQALGVLKKDEDSAAAFKRSAELSYQKDLALYSVARAYARLGQLDLAFHWLTEAANAGYRANSAGIYLNKDLRALRADPRWQVLFPDPTAAHPELSQAILDARIVSGVKTPMRDGVVLVSELGLPEGDERRPTILVRTPYNRKREFLGLKWDFWAKRGYAFVVQDVRGRFDSGGTFVPWESEQDDGYDTIDWITKQPWSNGKVGMIGGSYLGSVQWMAAASHHPALKCIIPQVSGTDPFFNVPYDHGVFEIDLLDWAAFLSGTSPPKLDPEQLKTLPLSKLSKNYLGASVPFFDHWLDESTPGKFGKANFLSSLEKSAPPALSISGWWDGNGGGTQLNWATMRKFRAENQWLIYGPWVHDFDISASLDDVYYGPQATFDLEAVYVRWFDYWLKDKKVGIEQMPRVQVFETGANKWRSLSDWPEEQFKTSTLYLDASTTEDAANDSGRLDEVNTESRVSEDRYTYNPTTLKTDGTNLPYPWFGSSTIDLHPNDNGILFYKTAALDHELEIGGPISLDVYFSTSGKDMDFFASLIDVDEVGRYHLVNLPAIFRARYLNGWESPKPLKPDSIYHATIELADVAHCFAKGHRVGLLIRSDMFPIYDRNLNTGEPIKNGTSVIVARQQIYHDAKHPSTLRFRILPPVANGNLDKIETLSVQRTVSRN